MSLKLCFKALNKFPKSSISLSGSNCFKSELNSYWFPGGRRACVENYQQSQRNGELLTSLLLPHVSNCKDAYVSSVIECYIKKCKGEWSIFGGKRVISLRTFKMEDIMHEYKCACLGINIFRHLTTVDPSSEVATDERGEIVWRLLGN